MPTSRRRRTLLALALGCVLAVFLFPLLPWRRWLGPTRGQSSDIVVLGEDFANIYAMDELKQPFETKLGIKLRFEKNTFDIFDQKAKEDLGNATNRFDVILHYSSLLSLAGKGNVLTVPELTSSAGAVGYDIKSIEDDLFQEVWKDSSYYPPKPGEEPVPMGFPFAANTMVLVYNRQMFEDPKAQAAYSQKFGEALVVPATWERFSRVAQFFTPGDGTSYGVVLQGASGSPLYWEWCNFAFGHGGGVMRKKYGWQGTRNTPLTLTSPETVAGTKVYVSLKPYSAGDFFSTGQAEQQERMRTQKIAMAIMWSDSLYLLEKDSPHRFGYARIPGSVSMIGGGTYFINRNSRNLDGAIRYVLESMQPASQVALMKKGLCSARRSVYAASELADIPYLQAVRDSLDKGVYMLESSPDSGLIRDSIERYLQEIWRGMPVEEGLRRAQETIEEGRAALYR